MDDKSTKIKILGVGNSCLDTYLYLDSFPIENKKTRVNNMEQGGGGNCSNMLTVLSRLGIDSYILTALGKDSLGTRIKEILQSDGIKTDLILELEGKQSPSSTVIVNPTNKSRTPIFFSSISFDTYIPISEETLLDFTWIHLDGRYHNTELKLVEMAKKKNIPISVEAERLGLKAEEHFPNAKIVFTSEHFPNDLYGSELDLESCQKRILCQGSEIVITTLGDQGCSILTEKGVLKVPAFHRDEIQIIDTTGAGDCFIGSFLYAYNVGYSLEESAKFANYMAAMKCSKPGARKGILYKKDIADYKFK